MKILLCLSILWLLLTGCQQFARKADNQPEYENNQGQSPPITSSNPSPSIGYAEEIRERVASTEEYDKINETGFVSALQKPLSTFSIDVDGASYSNARRFLERGQLPPPDAIRVEEFINYFDYDYPDPTGKDPFSVTTGMMLCPWNPEHQLIQIGIQGKKLEMDHLAASNLVFLIDVSGSMQGEGRLPLVKESLKLLLDELQAEDKVAIVVYASASGLVLPSTPVSEKEKIIATLDRLEAGGSTAGGEGIELAYRIAEANLIPEGNNRVILATDGDFNVGTSSTGALVRLIETKRKTGIYLTICGFGMGNYKDGRMEQISNAGNGNYYYIDDIREARKVFVEQMRATLFTIAKDVKIQVEFNPAKVQGYRLIGYENRRLNDQDFNDDAKDAGELGAGHNVTALYEIIPLGVTSSYLPKTDSLKYQRREVRPSPEWLTLKLRYKLPDEETSRLITRTVSEENITKSLPFAAAVSAFGMILQNSSYKGSATYTKVKELALSSSLRDGDPYKRDFLRLVKMAELISDKQ